ncbi:diaminopropionate ammonia-lyase [Frisingicoccus sp.]|uniref:diaminopropionate ammonia-lyase n=1 Tax=Frisingicoccus sp. TaxID=1918627 RepID=UPI0025C08138|nr:diaminopropionate ammonia-lyase [Frisingicoccus sp.]MDY4834232.1 diaminopropionate ammonia-lyase [Frisingicoccus sp.]MDY4923044.1 diaminopropionate ammonia-lyase [Frisingicoccus sp.]MDY5956432.1 diaminopropionate ammonia-lyase [Frisingicoccus sp.]
MSNSTANQIKWTMNNIPKTDDVQVQNMSLEQMEKAISFHRSFPQYTVTPLTRLSGLADYLGLKRVYVKDESYRFGLNAFKVLGGSYAIARCIADELGKDVSEVPYDVLTSDKLREEFGQATFFTATDGNHGRGVAWAANKLGQKCVVRMPKGTTQTRLENIAKENATVTIEELNYDDCVRMAAKEAAETTRGIMVQDTAWEGYEKIPTWIMQGYGTLAMEADKQLEEDGCRPTHIFIQAGVGSLAGGVIGYFSNRFKENPPIMVVAEANAADCLYRSAMQGDGNRVDVTGDMLTIMAGLACGEANTVSWDILRNHASAFVSCPDWVSANGTRIYGSPLRGDKQVISGESGSVTMGLLHAIMTRPEYKDLKEALKLDENSEVLLVSTEGDTDPDRYHEITWEGLYGTDKEPFADL